MSGLIYIENPELVAGVSGSGTINRLPLWTGISTLGNSALTQLGTLVGVNVAVPTAGLSLPAGTTAAASMNFATGSAPTTPNAGDLWFDGTYLYLRAGGINQPLNAPYGTGTQDRLSKWGPGGLGLTDTVIVQDNSLGYMNTRVVTTTETNVLALDSNAGVGRNFTFRSGGLDRFAMRVTGTESGSDTGGDWSLRRYDDAGVSLGQPLTAVRKDGRVYTSDNFGAGTDPGTGSAIFSLTGLVGGSGYAASASGVALTGGSGTGATASIVVSGGAVTWVNLESPGQGYQAGDVLSITGGTGTIQVLSVSKVSRVSGLLSASGRIGAGTTQPTAGIDSRFGAVVTGWQRRSQILSSGTITTADAYMLTIGGNGLEDIDVSSATTLTGIGVFPRLTSSTSRAVSAIRAEPQLVVTSGSTARFSLVFSGLLQRSSATDLNTNTNLRGMQLNVGNNNAAVAYTTPEISGVLVFANNTQAAGSVVTAQDGFRATISQGVTSAGTVTTSSLFRGVFFNVSSVVYTTFYGLRLENASITAPGTRPVNYWGISQEDAFAKNVFAGSTAIGLAAGTVAAAFLELAAGTTASAQIRFRTGVAPSSPATGDLWFDGTDFKARNGAGTQTVAYVGGPGVGTVTGSGTSGTIPRWTGATPSTTLGDSVMVQVGSGIGLGTSTLYTGTKLQVAGSGGIAAITSEDTNGGGNFLRWLADTTNNPLINWTTGSALRFATSTSAFGTFAERARIDSSGNLSLGASPSSGNRILLGGIGSGTSYVKANEAVVQMGNIFAGTLQLLTNNSPQMTVTSVGDVGIGTNSPGAKLDVNGAARAQYGVFTAGVSAFLSTTGALYTYYTSGTGIVAAFADNSSTAAPLDLFSGSVRGLRVTTTGNVGIGLTVPQTRAEINYGTLIAVAPSTPNTTTAVTLSANDPGTTAAGSGVLMQLRPITNRGAAVAIGAINESTNKDGGGALTFYYNNGNGTVAEAMRLSSAGNLGINVTPNASYKLHVNGTIAAWDGTNGRVALTPSGSALTGYVDWRNGAGTRLGYMGGGSSTNLNLNLENSANLLISGGNVGIGITTSPSATLEVGRTTLGVVDIRLSSAGTAYMNLYAGSGVGAAVLMSVQPEPLVLGTANSERMRIDSVGNVGIGGTPTTYKLEVLSSDLSVYDVRVGRGAAGDDQSTVVGRIALASNTTGGKNTAIGYATLNLASTANYTVAIGAQALQLQTGGDGNVAIGYLAGGVLTTGQNNTIIGTNACVANLITGSSNIVIGSGADTLSGSASNKLVIGSSANYVATDGGPTTYYATAGSSDGYIIINLNGREVKIEVFKV